MARPHAGAANLAKVLGKKSDPELGAPGDQRFFADFARWASDLEGNFGRDASQAEDIPRTAAPVRPDVIERRPGDHIIHQPVVGCLFVS